ncbi:MAG: hypothetical protein AAF849_10635 [Bacteroidota bacterium]
MQMKEILLLPLIFFYLTFVAIAQQNCLAFQGRDGKFEKNRLDTKTELLFTYTSEATKAYLPDKDLIKTTAYLTYIEGGYYLLNFIIDVALANAPSAYGNIPAKSNMVIHFLDGSKINLKSASTTIGIFREEEIIYRYRVEYPIGGSALKKLKGKELDKLDLTWTTGMESYEIYDIDFFKRHFECLLQHQ